MCFWSTSAYSLWVAYLPCKCFVHTCQPTDCPNEICFVILITYISTIVDALPQGYQTLLLCINSRKKYLFCFMTHWSLFHRGLAFRREMFQDILPVQLRWLCRWFFYYFHLNHLFLSALGPRPSWGTAGISKRRLHSALSSLRGSAFTFVWFILLQVYSYGILCHSSLFCSYSSRKYSDCIQQMKLLWNP